MKEQDLGPGPEDRPWTRAEIARTLLCLFAIVVALAIGCFARGDDAPPPTVAEKAHSALVDRLYALLLETHVAPPPKDRPETDEELHERLHEIAEDAADAANGDPPDALLLLGVDEEESHFALDVDKGPCREGACDHGRAACGLQIWGRDEAERTLLFSDRRYCFRRGLALLHGSEKACAGHLKEHRFARYAGGDCESLAAQKGSERLADYQARWRARWAALVAKEKRAKAAKTG